MTYDKNYVLKAFRAVGIEDTCIAEYRFEPTRRWRLDFAFVDKKVFIEVDGGIFVYGGHCRGARLMMEHEKYNAASVLGWRKLTVIPRLLLDPGFIHTVKLALGLNP